MLQDNHDSLPPEKIVILEDNSADEQEKHVVLDENTIILAAGDTYSLIDMDGLERVLDESDLSYQDISDAAGISVSSIYKFFSRTSKNPTFYNVVMIFRTIGASVDTLCGLKPRHKPAPAEELREKVIRLEDQIDKLQYTISVKDKRIADLINQKADAEALRDRYKDYFTHELEAERKQHQEDVSELNRRSTLRFVFAMCIAAVSILMFGLYLGADMILSGDYALLRQLFS